MNIYEEIKRDQQKRKNERIASFEKAINNMVTNQITFYADTECKAEILELLYNKNISHRIINVDGWAITLKINKSHTSNQGSESRQTVEQKKK